MCVGVWVYVSKNTFTFSPLHYYGRMQYSDPKIGCNKFGPKMAEDKKFTACIAFYISGTLAPRINGLSVIALLKYKNLKTLDSNCLIIS